MTILTTEQVLSAFQNRKSCRHYDPERKISEQDFRFILDLGRLSPSSVGSEPWRFVVVQNPELREKLKPFSWGMTAALDSASHIVVILAKKNLRFDTEYMLQGIQRRGVPEKHLEATLQKYESFQQEDIDILNDERALFDWCSKQTYIALGNMMTGAAMVGIDSCPIEGFNYAQMNRVLAEAGAFDPQEWGVSVAVTFGYRTREIEQKARQSRNEVEIWMK
ncbi:NAD(P)H-dependent oxidoreductase [Neisseriaceae bacterium B1]